MYVIGIIFLIFFMDYMLSMGTSYPGISGIIRKGIDKAKYLKELDIQADRMRSGLEHLDTIFGQMESETDDPAVLTSISRCRAQKEMCYDRLEQLVEAVEEGDTERSGAICVTLKDLIDRLEKDIKAVQLTGRKGA